MTILHLITALSLLASMTSSQTTDCRPGVNCKPPNCRCWNDESIPGGIDVKDTPQVVAVTFEYAVNDANVKLYTQLFENTANPNKCPAVGTFFVQEINSNLGIIKELFDNSHEIGVTSVDGTPPATGADWQANISRMRDLLEAVGVHRQDLLGVRAPQLQPGGFNEFLALSSENFLYDASCITSTFDEEGSLLWPYTYDFAPGPTCDGGETLEIVFPGIWQVMLPDLEFNGTKCATPSACVGVETERDVFDLFYTSFLKHYEGKRSPYLIVINPEWVTVDYKQKGTKMFLEYLRSAFSDTWILTVAQALKWVQQPVSNAVATANYPPWGC